MRIIQLVIPILVFVFQVQAQTRSSGTIYANSDTAVSLYFNDPIYQAIVGSDNFRFGFNREEKSKIGILKATTGNDSNIQVITYNGNIYSFVVKYQKAITSFNYFITAKNAIGNIDGDIVPDSPMVTQIDPKEIPKDQRDPDPVVENDFYISTENDSTTIYNEPSKEEASKMYLNNRNEYYNRYAYNLLEKEDTFYARFLSASHKVKLRLKKILYDKNELYFLMEIDNGSRVDYDINYLNFYLTAKKRRRKASSQKIPYEPVYIYNLPNRVEAKTTATFVFVFKKFTINNEKVIEVTLNEATGERNMVLPISYEYINNPYSFRNEK